MKSSGMLVTSIFPNSSSHDVDGQNAALMTGQQIIDEITDDRVGLVSQFRDDPANQRATARMPFQIDRAMRGLTMDFGPAMRATGPLMFSGNQIKPPELGIGHDLFAQRSTPGRDDLDHRLHPPRFNRKITSFAMFVWRKGAERGLQAASGTSRKHRYNPFQDVETPPTKCRRS
jgi:hypothetical protein